jgi:RNA polymerase sigma-70 factor (ECF subfamily)
VLIEADVLAVPFNRSSDPLPDTLEDLFREHHSLVYGTAYSVTGRPQEAEDVLQTVFLQLLRSGLPPDIAKNPRGYLYRAALNQALNVVRARRRLEKVIAPVDVEDARDVPEETAPDDRALRARLGEALATLSPRSLEMVLLRYQQHCPEAEIARRLGTSRSVVAVTLWRARARLRTLLTSTADEPPPRTAV